MNSFIIEEACPLFNKLLFIVQELIHHSVVWILSVYNKLLIMKS